MGSLKAFFRRHVRHRRRGPPKSASLTPTPSISSHHRLLSVLPPADELHRVFSRFDANGDGRISSDELASIFSGLGHPPTDEELHSMMAEADTDGDGFISLEEFVDLNTRGVRPDDALEDLREAFGVFDLDGNGAISAEELAKVMRGLGDENATTAECRKMIVGVDRDGDGAVSFEEFKEMMLSSGNSHYSIDERSSPEDQGSSLSPELAAS